MTTRGPNDFTPTPPPTSDLPEAEPAPERDAVVPHPNVAGGLDNIPEEILPTDERVQDELDHAGMDEVLPGEDRAPGEPLPEERKHQH
jgi:hypothetical protein